MIGRYPSEIIVVDEDDGNATACTVKLVDSGSATVTIDRATNAREWQEISAQVLGALLDMRLDGDITM